jgi:hypothetical protein
MLATVKIMLTSIPIEDFIALAQSIRNFSLEANLEI